MTDLEQRTTTLPLEADIIRSTLFGEDDPQPTDAEITMFVAKCRALELDPYLNEIYLVKYKEKQPAKIIISKDTFMRRGFEQEDFNYFEAGIIVARGVPENKDLSKADEIIRRPGSFIIPGEVLLGGWCKIYFHSERPPHEMEVAEPEYSTGQSSWRSKPATMIRKVAIAQAFREAFPLAMAGHYIADEMGIEEVEESE